MLDYEIVQKTWLSNNTKVNDECVIQKYLKDNDKFVLHVVCLCSKCKKEKKKKNGLYQFLLFC